MVASSVSSISRSEQSMESHNNHNAAFKGTTRFQTMDDDQSSSPRCDISLCSCSLDNVENEDANRGGAVGVTAEYESSHNSEPHHPLIWSCQVSARIPSIHAHNASSSKNFNHRILLYTSDQDPLQHMALVFGDIIQSTSLNLWRPEDEQDPQRRKIRGALPDPLPDKKHGNHFTHSPPLVRIHSCCFTGETLGSLRCDCADQLHEAIRLMSLEGSGVILYLQQEGRGIGLLDKLKAYNLIDMGYDTLSANVALGHPPDARNYEIAYHMLQDLGLSQIRLLTNNPQKLEALESRGISIVERVPMIPSSWKSKRDTTNRPPASSTSNGNQSIDLIQGVDIVTEKASTTVSSDSNTDTIYHYDQDVYLVTKIQKMGHLLDIPATVLDRVASSSSSASSS